MAVKNQVYKSHVDPDALFPGVPANPPRAREKET
jgi:hypothetical protein